MTEKIPVLLLKEFDISKLTYGSMKSFKGNPPNCRPSYNQKPYILQLPECFSHKGVVNAKEMKNTKTTVDKYFIEIPLDEKNPKMMELKNYALAVDEFNLNCCVKNSKEFYGEESTREEIIKHKMYDPLVRKSTDPKYPDKLKLKFTYGDYIVKQGKEEINIGRKAGFDVSLQVTEDGKKTWKDINISIDNDKGQKDIDWAWNRERIRFIPLVMSEGLYIIGKKTVYNPHKIKWIRILENVVQTVTSNSFREDESESDNKVPVPEPAQEPEKHDSDQESGDDSKEHHAEYVEESDDDKE
jgi:hypothetical protein